jgi:hypothetical protein
MGLIEHPRIGMSAAAPPSGFRLVNMQHTGRRKRLDKQTRTAKRSKKDPEMRQLHCQREPNVDRAGPMSGSPRCFHVGRRGSAYLSRAARVRFASTCAGLVSRIVSVVRTRRRPAAAA